MLPPQKGDANDSRNTFLIRWLDLVVPKCVGQGKSLHKGRKKIPIRNKCGVSVYLFSSRSNIYSQYDELGYSKRE